LNLTTQNEEPTPTPIMPAIVKEKSNLVSPKLQKITKSPTIAIIAPNTHVSKAYTA
jgi:hypothetical protein